MLLHCNISLHCLMAVKIYGHKFSTESQDHFSGLTSLHAFCSIFATLLTTHLSSASRPQTPDYKSGCQGYNYQTSSSCKMRHFLLLLPCLVSALDLDQGALDEIKSLANVRTGGEEGARRWSKSFHADKSCLLSKFNWQNSVTRIMCNHFY